MNAGDKSYHNLIILLHQFFSEEDFPQSLHSLEQESRVFFNGKYFGECIINGDWEIAEKYLGAFTKRGDNDYSWKLFFELQKQKYLEEFERNDDLEAIDILWKNLNMFSFNEEIRNELEKLPTNFTRAQGVVSPCLDIPSARSKLLFDVELLLKLNPTLKDKLVLPRVDESGLFSLIKLMCPDSENIKEELIYLILQFLEEDKCNETARMLEQESKIFFNMAYFEQLVIGGKWDKAEKYLSAFVNTSEDDRLMSTFFEMKRKNFEALDRENMLRAVKNTVQMNGSLLDKIKFPDMDKFRLLTIIKEGLEWWVRYGVNEKNKNISFDTIPKVSNLFLSETSSPSDCLDQGVVVDQSSSESRDLTCCVDEQSMAGIKAMEISNICETTTEPSVCCTLVLPDNSLEEMVSRLIYSDSGDFILALSDDATHKLWTYKNDQHSSTKENENVQPRLYRPSSGLTMVNEVGTDCGNSCLTLQNLYLYSMSGGKISIFNLETFEKLQTFGKPPPEVTYFLFLDWNVFAMGCHDSTIRIHSSITKRDVAKLEGHQRQITCLAFSEKLNVLVSSGADAQICVWDANKWQKLSSKFLQNLCTGDVLDQAAVNHIQFRCDQIHLLAVNDRHLDIYKAPSLDHLAQWVTQESDVAITSATYSCNGESIYICCKIGCIKVLVSKTLQVRCRIDLTTNAQPSASLQVLRPLIVAAHPSNPNQIAVGLSNGRVYVLEPLSSGEWGSTALLEHWEG